LPGGGTGDPLNYYSFHGLALTGSARL
jgi:hypothetical protein